MEAILREGALRLLASETSCDVILSCQGQKLTAHKIMLSIASPILHDLLIEEKAEIAVVIFPDISGRTMSHLLDYIYNGSVLVPSQTMEDFLTAASLLKVHVDLESTSSSKLSAGAAFSPYTSHLHHGGVIGKPYADYNGGIKEDFLKPPDPKTEFYKTPPPSSPFGSHSLSCGLAAECLGGGDRKVTDLSSAPAAAALPLGPLAEASGASQLPVSMRKKTLRKVPNLMPISRYAAANFRLQKGNYNRPAPSPWCPRMVPLITDPREECLNATSGSTSSPSPEYHHEKNDSNNNFQFSDPLVNSPYYVRRPCGRSNSPKNMCLNKPPLYYAAAAAAAGTPRLTSSPTTTTTTTTNSTNNNSGGSSFQGDSATNLATTAGFKQAAAALLEQPPHPPPASRLLVGPPPSLPPQIAGLAAVGAVLALPEASEVLRRPPCSSAPCSSSGEDAPEDGLVLGLHPDDGLIDEECKDSDGKGDEGKLKPYKCEDCGKTFSQLRNFKYHRSVHEGTREFAARCPECGKLFQDRGYLSSHMKIHRDRKEYACPSCPKRFNQRVAYNMHLRIHTGVKPHECTTCGKSFSRKMLLKQHQRVHTGERPYKCPQCGKSFADRSNMSLHARLHTGVKPYACSLCPKSFTKKHHLKTHMNYHTGLKPYSCEHCGLAFSQSSNMRTHYKKCVLKPPPPTT